MPYGLVIKNGNLVNVCTGEIYKTDVLIEGGRITGVRENISGGIEIDAEGKYIVPGLIESHTHIESSMVSLTQFACAVIPRGTTTVVNDPHEIANVLGIEGIKFLIEESKNIPINVYFTIPSCVPATPFETSGKSIGLSEVIELVNNDKIIGLGEVMNFPGVISGDPEILSKIRAAIDAGKTVDGHCPGLSGKLLDKYISAGIMSEHEATTGEEAIEKLSKGMVLMIREGSAARNISILKLILNKNLNLDRCVFACDDRHPKDLIGEGHIDQIIKKAISLGADPVDAVRMATINPATYFNLRNKGVIAPGKDADILILKSLKEFEIDKVIIGGRVVFEDNGMVKKLNDYSYPDFVKNTVNVKPLSEGDFDVKVCGVEDSVRARIIGVIEGELITNSIIRKIKVRNNTLIPDADFDVLKIAVVERHHKTGNIGLGFVSGFGLNRGAFASSVSHDSHNIVAVGTNSRDMLSAVNKIIEMQGGFAIADNTEIYGLQLNIAGLMSEKPVSEVNNNLNFLQNKLRENGVKIRSPFMALSFLALPVIPKLKLTDRGLFDAEKFMFTEVLVR